MAMTLRRGKRLRSLDDPERSSSKRPTSLLGDPRHQLSSGQIPFRGVKRASDLPGYHLHRCSSSRTPFWGAKRARSVLGGPPRRVSSPSDPKWRDWSNLGDGPAGLIAEHLLANDVADYIRFRAVCCPWRQWSTDPRAHGILDRRFHPRKWIMLRETTVAAAHHRRLLNVSTGQCIRMHLPELRGHHVFGPTTEGLLVLLDRSSYVVRLLNPLTGQVTNLPPATTLFHLIRYERAPTADLGEGLEVSAAGLADDSTFAVYFCGIHMLAVAKPGDECWTLVDDQGISPSPGISFEGRFYCTANRSVMVVETSTSANQRRPRLVVAAKLTRPFSLMSSTVHLVDNDGELILVCRTIQRCQHDEEEEFSDNKEEYFIKYNAYQVDLKAMNTKPVLGFGGRAIFIGLRNPLSVSTAVFPSIKNDSIYVGLDCLLGTSLESNNRLYCLMDGTSERCGILEHGGFDEEEECSSSSSGMPSQFGPWGIDDCLSWYVTDSHDSEEDA